MQWTGLRQDGTPAPVLTAPNDPPATPYAAVGMSPKVAVDTNTVWVWLAVAASRRRARPSSMSAVNRRGPVPLQSRSPWRSTAWCP